MSKNIKKRAFDSKNAALPLHPECIARPQNARTPFKDTCVGSPSIYLVTMDITCPHLDHVGRGECRTYMQFSYSGWSGMTMCPSPIGTVDVLLCLCTQPTPKMHKDTVSERLRRWTRNPLGSARRGSNPLGVALRWSIP